jgi:hypothetical protein
MRTGDEEQISDRRERTEREREREQGNGDGVLPLESVMVSCFFREQGNG